MLLRCVILQFNIFCAISFVPFTNAPLLGALRFPLCTSLNLSWVLLLVNWNLCFWNNWDHCDNLSIGHCQYSLLKHLFAGYLRHTDIIAQRPHVKETGVALRDAETVSKQSMIQPDSYKQTPVQCKVEHTNLTVLAAIMNSV